MSNTHLVMRIGSIGAAAALLMLVVIALIPWPFDFFYPGEEVLSGKLELSSTDLVRYVTGSQIYLVADTLFVICWFIAWVGISTLVRTRDRLLGQVVLGVGLLGASFDFAQNGIEWALIQSQRLDIDPQPGWFVAWTVVSQLSYLLPYTAAMMAALGLWSTKPLDRVMCIVGAPLTILAVVGLYVPDWYALAFLWYVALFLYASVLLWRRAQVANE